MTLALVPVKAKLIAGLLYPDGGMFDRACDALVGRCGGIDLTSGPFPFDHSDYYRDMGSLTRVYVSFKKLIRREEIVDIKLFTNELETALSGGGQRRINIDPGYLTMSNLFLASCKEYYHRAYLNRGVYLENEYRYSDGRFNFWEWTYPDYRRPEAVGFFTEARGIYRAQIRKGEG
ncbi:MAG TPA: DUF4416 family protein [Spirochaetota bacterium]|nr:DUF4416 family protein [Spirochaetota bacterium]HPI91253.1 DUF4416 family protein [Spirochaetota bacterium]HPR50108.1 DUF4416 family protein [Spirochaetota bacterium]